KTYPNAPNPTIRLNTLGHVGLPLSEREAKNVTAYTLRDLSGAAFIEGTLGGPSIMESGEPTTVVHSFLMDSFDNPEWQSFLCAVVKDIWGSLDVDPATSITRFEPSKLFLVANELRGIELQGPHNPDDTFGTVVLTLPSRFTGGITHLSHAGTEAVVDQSENSLLDRSVMTWYTDVAPEFEPIQSGYRLILGYSLINASSSLPVF
ncbi:hypothetical protein FRB90_002020, partial [Tulasnella sp. 427]